MVKFVLEDDLHAAPVGTFDSRDEAIAEARRLAAIGYAGENLAPCTSWETCERAYILYEYDYRTSPYLGTEAIELSSVPIVTIGADGVRWHGSFGPSDATDGR